ncbi:NAD(P)H-dependent flavin oxidoreductase [Macrococcus brunensis]|uniref:NAD(P)H-dependent flavin oxidoreductase n=1 Tax=Macrococcus brunensis TaxID=198483 RepID=UPI001EF156DF|nr:nitronate monooxygenase [Macrococcus brunensis]ULG73854.1 nitronate monooxygenase [Macrococcus brunensis]
MLSFQYPIIQAPMAGGIIPPEFVAAVSNAGCLGSIAAGNLSLSKLADQIKMVQSLTEQPFQVNLFANDWPAVQDVSAVNEELNKIRKTLNLPVRHQYDFTPDASLTDYVDLCIELNVPIVSFTFGCPDSSLVDKLHKADITVIGTISTVDEALIMQQAGVDAVVAQGYEAGGHKGGFSDAASIGLMALVPQVVDAVRLPVIAAGGISDSRGIQAAHALGASYVQIGTRFLNTVESTAHSLHKKAVTEAIETDALYTQVFTGKTARGIQNQMMTQLAHLDLPSYAYMNIMTKDIRAAAKNQQEIDYMSNWSGQNIRTSETLPLDLVLTELTASFH